MVPAVAALAVCLSYGPLWLRATAVMTALQFALYMAYLDLLPNGLFRYLNYHYFRWPLWLAFMMLPAACVLLYRRFGTRAWIPGVPLIVGATVLACLQFRTIETNASVEQRDDRIVVHLEPNRRIDYVDVVGLTGDWQKTFSPSAASLDGRVVPFYVQFRTLPGPNGTRFLFLRPMQGERLEIARSGWTISPGLTASIGRYHFTLGAPRWLQGRPPEIRAGASLALDGGLSRDVFADGFAEFDGRGRRLVKDTGVLRLPLDPRSMPYVLRLKLTASNPIRVGITVDGDAAASRTIEAKSTDQEFDIRISPEEVATWRPAVVRIDRLPAHDGRGADGLVVTGLRVE